MSASTVPPIDDDEIADWLRRAGDSPRQRLPRILHEPGAEFNEVFNFMRGGTYMQPHHHPAEEKVEKIYLVRGRLAVIYFEDDGTPSQVTVLSEAGTDRIEVPAFTWHTYVMLSDEVVTYETMMGRYEPSSWKEFAQWAPAEDAPESAAYLRRLKAIALDAGA